MYMYMYMYICGKAFVPLGPGRRAVGAASPRAPCAARRGAAHLGSARPRSGTAPGSRKSSPPSAAAAAAAIQPPDAAGKQGTEAVMVGDLGSQ